MATLSQVVFEVAFLLPPIAVALGAIVLAVTRRAARPSTAAAPEVAIH